MIHQDNAGNAAARNTALREARGKYVAFLDCDDTVVNTMLLDMAESVRIYPDAEVFNYNDIGNLDSSETHEREIDKD